ncbi:MAG: OmpA family protein [Planctomycetota bacterium]
MRTPLRLVSAGLLMAGLLSGGCVSQGDYDDAEMSARAQRARNQELLQENQNLQAMVRDKDERIASLERDKSRLNTRVTTLSSEVEELEGGLRGLDSRLQNWQFGSLNPATDRALQQLASRNPDLVKYDAEMGMLQFGSDLTFDSGSDVVKRSAMSSLDQLARILRTSDAGEYDIRIVGHTDSQKPSASRGAHPTNRHLAVHRAIAVAATLEKAGVPGERIEVAGWGEYRPAVANNRSGGTAANRRVEVYLVPATGEGGGAANAGGGDTTEPQQGRSIRPMK